MHGHMNTDPLQRFVASLMLPISLFTVSAFLELAALTDCCTAIGTIFSNKSKNTHKIIQYSKLCKPQHLFNSKISDVKKLYCIILTYELLAEWCLNRSCFDERCFADVLQIFDLRHAVVVYKIVVFLCSCKRTVDLIRQIFHINIFIVSGSRRLHQLRGMLQDTRERIQNENVNIPLMKLTNKKTKRRKTHSLSPVDKHTCSRAISSPNFFFWLAKVDWWSSAVACIIQCLAARTGSTSWK